MRERGLNGNDRCKNGHTYPSRSAHSGFDDSMEATIKRLNESALSGAVVTCSATDLHRVLAALAPRNA